MTLTAREHEEIIERASHLPWFLKIAKPLGYVLRPLAHIPWISRKIAQSPSALVGAIFEYQRQGDHQNAVNTAVFGIEKYQDKGAGRFGFMNHHYWWSFMRYGVENLSQLESSAEERERFIAFAKDGIKPFKGYDVAYVYYCLARWRYEAGDLKEAMQFAQRASRADRTWGEPDFLLGWLALVSGMSHGADHLRRAVRKDPRIIFRVASDPICKGRPDVLAQIKQLPELKGIVVTSGERTQD